MVDYLEYLKLASTSDGMGAWRTHGCKNLVLSITNIFTSSENRNWCIERLISSLA